MNPCSQIENAPWYNGVKDNNGGGGFGSPTPAPTGWPQQVPPMPRERSKLAQRADRVMSVFAERNGFTLGNFDPANIGQFDVARVEPFENTGANRTLGYNSIWDFVIANPNRTQAVVVVYAFDQQSTSEEFEVPGWMGNNEYNRVCEDPTQLNISTDPLVDSDYPFFYTLLTNGTEKNGEWGRLIALHMRASMDAAATTALGRDADLPINDPNFDAQIGLSIGGFPKPGN